MDSIYQALTEIVGEDYASNRQEELFTYSKDLGTSEPKWPDYVAAPKTAQQVSEIILLANKEDLGKDVKEEDIENLRAEIGAIKAFRTSALTSHNVNDAFLVMVEALIESHQ